MLTWGLALIAMRSTFGLKSTVSSALPGRWRVALERACPHRSARAPVSVGDRIFLTMGPWPKTNHIAL